MYNEKEIFQEMAWKGSFIFERSNLKGIVIDNQDFSEDEKENLVNLRINRWISSLGKDFFEKRISSEDLTDENVRFICNEYLWGQSVPLPSWISTIKQIFSLYPANADLTDELNSILIPIVNHYYHDIKKHLKGYSEFLSDKVFNSIREDLFNRLSNLLKSTLRQELNNFISKNSSIAKFMGASVLDLDQSNNYLRDFIENLSQGGFKSILITYPVLSRLIVYTISSWKNHILKILDNFSKEKLQLNDTYNKGVDLGKVIDIKFQISNCHNGGKSCCIFKFENGKKFLYKPRSTNVNQRWSSFLSIINQYNPKHTLLCIESLDYTDHGWTEYVNSKPLEKESDAEGFYFRMGMLMGLFYALGGNNFYCDKLVAYGDQPIITDFDTLLLPKVDPFNSNQRGYSASERAIEFLSDSVLRLGMLPIFSMDKGGSSKDMGALTGKSDNMSSNIPWIGNKKMNAREFVEVIIEGFHFSYYLFGLNKKIATKAISIFRDCRCRFLIRNSQVYIDLIERISHPDFLRDGFDYSVEVERLSLAYLPTEEDSILKDIWSIFSSERLSLTFRDIPLFFSQPNGKALIDNMGVVYNRYFSLSGIMHFKQIIDNFGAKDYNMQISLISNSLDVHCDYPNEEAFEEEIKYDIRLVPNECKEEFLSEAFSIYRTILDNRIRGENKGFTWISPINDFRFKCRKFSVIGSNLYDGIMGIGLFISMLYSVTKDRVIMEYALETVEELRTSIREEKIPIRQLGLGLVNGLAGYMIGLYHMGLYLEDESLIQDAVFIFNKVSDGTINNDYNIDLANGVSGFISACYILKDIVNKDNLTNIINLCAEKIKDTKLLQPGAAYGISGVSTALVKAYDITGNKIFLEKTKDFILIEDKNYDKSRNNWAEKSHDGTLNYKIGWCNGAPGIGISRVSVSKILNDAKIIEDIKRACDFSIKIGNKGIDQLCYGVSSRIELLLEAGMHLNDDQLIKEANILCKEIIARKDNIGHYKLNINDDRAIFNPSLFQGISGIGYILLRCAFPERIKSILI